MKEFLYFSADWCAPCKQLSPIMEQINQEGMLVRKINVDTNSQLAAQYQVKSIPTVILLKFGNEVGRKVGNSNKIWYINMWQSN